MRPVRADGHVRYKRPIVHGRMPPGMLFPAIRHRADETLVDERFLIFAHCIASVPAYCICDDCCMLYALTCQPRLDDPWRGNYGASDTERTHTFNIPRSFLSSSSFLSPSAHDSLPFPPSCSCPVGHGLRASTHNPTYTAISPYQTTSPTAARPA